MQTLAAQKGASPDALMIISWSWNFPFFSLILEEGKMIPFCDSCDDTIEKDTEAAASKGMSGAVFET